MPFIDTCRGCQKKHLFPDNTPAAGPYKCQCGFAFAVTRPEERQEALLLELCARLKMINVVIWIMIVLAGVGMLISLVVSIGGSHYR